MSKLRRGTLGEARVVDMKLQSSSGKERIDDTMEELKQDDEQSHTPRLRGSRRAEHTTNDKLGNKSHTSDTAKKITLSKAHKIRQE